jgi:hypothetical protein
MRCLDESNAPFNTHTTLILAGPDSMTEQAPEMKGGTVTYKRCGPPTTVAQAKPTNPYGNWRVRNVNGELEAILPLSGHPAISHFRMYCGTAGGIALQVPHRNQNWGKRAPISIKGTGVGLMLIPNAFDLVSGMAGGEEFLAAMTRLQQMSVKTLTVESEGKSGTVDFDGAPQVVALMRSRCH